MSNDRSPFAWAFEPNARAREWDEYHAAFPRLGAPAWGFVDGSPGPLSATLRARLRLWSRIVGRGWHTGRLGPRAAWRICAGVHPWREPVKRWSVGGVDEREGGTP